VDYFGFSSKLGFWDWVAFIGLVLAMVAVLVVHGLM